MLSMSICSCSTSRHVQTVPIKAIRHDTLYINKESYDSTYLSVEHWQEYHPSAIDPESSILNHESSVINRTDTIVIKDISIEYRYRMLRDTVRIATCDSIPYEVRITEVKEVRHIPPWCKWLSIIGAISITVMIISLMGRVCQKA